jgi:hypothetical protein
MKSLIRARLRRPSEVRESALRAERDIALTILEAERRHSQELECLLSEMRADLERLRETVRQLRAKEHMVVMMVDSEDARKHMGAGILASRGSARRTQRV